MEAKYEEQGTSISGYEEKGPYHCEDCIHAKDGAKCWHPVVALDHSGALANKRRGDGWVEINLEKGCCKYVNQSGSDRGNVVERASKSKNR